MGSLKTKTLRKLQADVKKRINENQFTIMYNINTKFCKFY